MTVKSIHFENAPQRVHHIFFCCSSKAKRKHTEYECVARTQRGGGGSDEGGRKWEKKHDLHWFDRLLVPKQLNRKTAEMESVNFCQPVSAIACLSCQARRRNFSNWKLVDLFEIGFPVVSVPVFFLHRVCLLVLRPDVCLPLSLVNESECAQWYIYFYLYASDTT